MNIIKDVNTYFLIYLRLLYFQIYRIKCIKQSYYLKQRTPNSNNKMTKKQSLTIEDATMVYMNKCLLTN